MSASRGLNAQLYLNGTLVGYMMGIDLSWTKAYEDIAQLGGYEPSDALIGAQSYSGAYRKAYINNTFLSYFINNQLAQIRIRPRGDAYCLVGSMILTSGNLRNMETAETAAVLEEGTFLLFDVDVGGAGSEGLCGSFDDDSFDGSIGGFDICPI